MRKPFYLRILAFIRAVIFGPLMGIYTLFQSAAVVLHVFFAKDPIKTGDWYIITWAKVICFVYRIKLTVQGLENIPKTGCIFLFNHTSNFDIPIAHAAIPKSFRFGAKIELYSIPIFGQMMQKIGALPIARGERSKVLALYKKSVPRLHQGESFMLAAEGTRTLTAQIGNKFKTGPFIFAVAAQVPIVPVVFKGIFDFYNKKDLFPALWTWTNPVAVKILPPIATFGYSEDNIPELVAKAQTAMTKAFNEG
jgi:1-acyl-sn-glycerol-3-phosphate acyltransferase